MSRPSADDDQRQRAPSTHLNSAWLIVGNEAGSRPPRVPRSRTRRRATPRPRLALRGGALVLAVVVGGDAQDRRRRAASLDGALRPRATATERGSTYSLKFSQFSPNGVALAKPATTAQNVEDDDRDEDQLRRLVRRVVLAVAPWSSCAPWSPWSSCSSRARATAPAWPWAAVGLELALLLDVVGDVVGRDRRRPSPRRAPRRRRAAAPRGSPKNVRYVARAM